MASLLRAAEAKLDRIRQNDPTLSGISIEALPGKDITHTVTDGGVHRFTGALALSDVESITSWPPADYDSGWISVPSANSSITLQHDLGAFDFTFVQIQHSRAAEADGADGSRVIVAGVSSSGSGSYGNAIMTDGANHIKVNSYIDGAAAVVPRMNWTGDISTHMRIRLWR